VVSKLRWQTWEPIYVGVDVTGPITLRVQDQSLETVLDIINEQINGRWSAVYPLYSSGSSLAVARTLARGEVAGPVTGWTNWNNRMPPGRGSPRGSGLAGPEIGSGAPMLASLNGRSPGRSEMAWTRASRISLNRACP